MLRYQLLYIFLIKLDSYLKLYNKSISWWLKDKVKGKTIKL